MNKVKIALTVFFEDPFWVGIFEAEAYGTYKAARYVFGAEPSDEEVYLFILEKYSKLKFSPALKSEPKVERKISPKRKQRLAAKQLQNRGASTKSQLALSQFQEQQALERKATQKLQKEKLSEIKYRMRQEKKKRKHKGH